MIMVNVWCFYFQNTILYNSDYQQIELELIHLKFEKIIHWVSVYNK